jgi:hypothetical protein
MAHLFLGVSQGSFVMWMMGFGTLAKLGGASENLKKYRVIWQTWVMLKHAFL